MTLPSNKKISFGRQEVFELPGSKTHPLGGYMDKAAFDKIAKYGCTWCQQDVEFEDVGVTIYENTDTVLCGDCSGNAEGSSRIYCSSN